jgi:hypothetical protein
VSPVTKPTLPLSHSMTARTSDLNTTDPSLSDKVSHLQLSLPQKPILYYRQPNQFRVTFQGKRWEQRAASMYPVGRFVYLWRCGVAWNRAIPNWSQTFWETSFLQLRSIFNHPNCPLYSSTPFFLSLNLSLVASIVMAGAHYTIFGLKVAPHIVCLLDTSTHSILIRSIA